MNSGLKSGLVLLVLGIISGVLLAIVNSFTAPVIADMEQEKVNSAIAEFYNIDNYTITEQVIDANGVDTIYILTNKSTDNIDALVYLVASGGYNGDVTMLIAVNSDFSVEGYTVVSQAENPPISQDFTHHDYNVTNITDMSGFDAIAGATFSSNAVRGCFTIVQDRVQSDFGGGLGD